MTIPKLCCLQGQISASLPVLHYLPASTAITTNNNSAFHKYNQTVTAVEKRRPKPTLYKQHGRERLALEILKLAAVTNGLSRHTRLSLLLPPSLMNLPAENTSLTVALRRRQLISGLGLNYCTGIRWKAWLRFPSLESDPLLIACSSQHSSGSLCSLQLWHQRWGSHCFQLIVFRYQCHPKWHPQTSLKRQHRSLQLNLLLHFPEVDSGHLKNIRIIYSLLSK